MIFLFTCVCSHSYSFHEEKGVSLTLFCVRACIFLLYHYKVLQTDMFSFVMVYSIVILTSQAVEIKN